MATDVLILGSLAFDDWSTPSKMGYGGRQQTAVHKLPGGARVVDTLGPDEKDIHWTGTFWGDTAFADAQTLQGMRLAGQVVALTFAGMSYQVIIQEAHPVLERFPLFVTYAVSCLVVSNPMAGTLGGITSNVGDLVSADLATAISITEQPSTPQPATSGGTPLGQGGIGSQ